MCLYLLMLTYISCLKLSLPALVYLKELFKVSDEHMKLTVTCFAFSFGISIYIWGILIAKYKRRTIIYMAFSIIATGSILVFTSFSYWQYIIGRSIEGFGVGFASILCRTCMQDVYTKHHSSKILGNMSFMVQFIPAIAPIKS